MDKNFDNIYPLTIVRDRYSGAYSGGQYLAFQKHSDNLPFEPNSNDMMASEYWENEEEYDYKIGKGSTPNEAYLDLFMKLNIGKQ